MRWLPRSRRLLSPGPVAELVHHGMSLTHEYFIGAWRDSHDSRSFELASDGSAVTHFGASEQHPGTWRFRAPDTLVVRVVIPLNIPDIDDELNAEEMIFTIKNFAEGSFAAGQFDYESDCTFTRDVR